MRNRDLPECSTRASMKEVVASVSAGRLGVVLVMQGEVLKGVITDGDLRRALEQHENPMGVRADQIMTIQPKTVRQDIRLGEAAEMMHTEKVSFLVAVDEKERPVGILSLHDC